jgi:hypothetical protein
MIFWIGGDGGGGWGYEILTHILAFKHEIYPKIYIYLRNPVHKHKPKY